jgi:MFS family permease
VYRLDWLEQLKLRVVASPNARQMRLVSPIVWSLGLTSLLTDISTEMVSSALPTYLVLHLHLSPLQYGIIDGLYNGFALALLGVVAGIVSDRLQRHKEVAAFGYALSGVCKLLLLTVGTAWGGIAAVLGLERAGKGIRAAPRDALISFCTPPEAIASAFAVHRGLDAGGAVLGPIVAFIILSQMPGAFDVLWVASFLFAVLGFAVLWMFVPRPHQQLIATNADAQINPLRIPAVLLSSSRLRALVIAGTLLSIATISDGFLYLQLHERAGTDASLVPIYYVGTACFYMIFSIPVGLAADRWGRARILLGGYLALGAVYVLLFAMTGPALLLQVGCLVLMGIYYAATEGMLMAASSALIPAHARTSGLALMGAALGVGKMISSIAFGWLWSSFGLPAAVSVFGVALAVMVLAAGIGFQKTRRG